MGRLVEAFDGSLEAGNMVPFGQQLSLQCELHIAMTGVFIHKIKKGGG